MFITHVKHIVKLCNLNMPECKKLGWRKHTNFLETKIVFPSFWRQGPFQQTCKVPASRSYNGLEGLSVAF